MLKRSALKSKPLPEFELPARRQIDLRRAESAQGISSQISFWTGRVGVMNAALLISFRRLRSDLERAGSRHESGTEVSPAAGFGWFRASWGRNHEQPSGSVDAGQSREAAEKYKNAGGSSRPALLAELGIVANLSAGSEH